MKQVSTILIPVICEILFSINGLKCSIESISIFKNNPQSPLRRQISVISSICFRSFKIRLISLKSGSIFTVALVSGLELMEYSIVNFLIIPSSCNLFTRRLTVASVLSTFEDISLNDILLFSFNSSSIFKSVKSILIHHFFLIIVEISKFIDQIILPYY